MIIILLYLMLDSQFLSAPDNKIWLADCLPKMTEEVWRQALSFLDTFRAGEHGGDLAGLYSLADSDQTGVLSKHRQKLLQPFSDRQVDMKIIFYELIKMLMDHDKSQLSEEEYYVTNTVHKIEGYQQLTNKVTL